MNATGSGSVSGGSTRTSLSSNPQQTSPAKPATASAMSTPMKSPELKKVKVKSEVATPKKSLDARFGVVFCLQACLVIPS